MTGENSGRLTAAERRRFEAAVVDATTPGYVVVRALIALGGETTERLARSTAMGRDFVTGVGRRVAGGKGAGLLIDKPNTVERVLETATGQIVAAGRSELAMSTVSAAAGISRRTLYRQFTASALIDACERRAMTIWRARFERRIQSATADAVGRLFLIADDIADWVVSERFHADQVLRPASVEDPRGGALSEHMEALRTFAIGLAQEAQVAEPARFGNWVALNVAGVAAWVNRRQEAHSLAIAFVEYLTGVSRLR